MTMNLRSLFCLILLQIWITYDKWFCLWSQEIGEKLSDIGSRWDYPCLTREIAKEIETLWNDAAIQVDLLDDHCQ